VTSGPVSFVDLHCHTRASFDCLSAPKAVVTAAADRGLTHLAITDHDRIDGALEARTLAPAGLTVIVGEEVRTLGGDLICLFLQEAIPPGLPAGEAIAVARAQGGLVGLPHPFDRLRGSLLRDPSMEAIASSVDWVETHNARLLGGGNERAAAFAGEHGLPGVAVSDAHSILEVAIAYTRLEGDPGTPAGLLAALSSAQVVPGRASLVIRSWTPLAKLVQRARGNGRILPPPTRQLPSGPRDLS
jgi:predicted metal-dependent phosphoesterase TrpH